MSGYRYGLLSVILGVCLQWPVAVQAAEPAADGTVVTLLQYEEQEPGTDVYPLRILVSQRYVRIDDGDDQGDYILLDRDSRRISGVNHAERNILVIVYHEVAAGLPPDLQLSESGSTDMAAPAIQGRQPVNYRLLANGELCRQLVAVPGLLEPAVSALAEYARVLGMRQLNSLERVPESLQTPCFLARYAYAPARHLAHGLPLQVWDNAGYRRTLVNYRASVRVSPALFDLPAGYTEFSVD